MSMQEPPHDGVAALAVPALSAPAMPTPPTKVSVAAVASTLLLMDMKQFLSWNHGRTLRTAVVLIRAGTADPIGGWYWLQRRRSGRARKLGGYEVRTEEQRSHRRHALITGRSQC